MINLYNTEIENLHIHKVGNKCRKEELFLSQDAYAINDEIRPILKEFFLKPFRDKEAQFFKFSEGSELGRIFKLFWDFPFVFVDSAIHYDIARHLYDQGNHPHIKAGEVYICELNNIITDEGSYSGIGIFKSEIRYDFLEFNQTQSRLDLILKQGVSLDKLDKGAIIIKDEAREMFRILYIDSNKYDSKYWLDNFLSLEEMEDSIFQTKNYLKFCESFGKEVIKPTEGHQAEMEFVNDTYNYFAKKEEFEENEFLQNVFDEVTWSPNTGEIIAEFENYKLEVGPKYSIEDLTEFPISNETVNDCMKKIKGEIVLDTGITIKVAKGSQSASKYLEKGWDEEKQMYYYLSYFNKEEK